jgi:polysaccharide deacetylase 2 family uncharacterized protein YibQ
MIPSLAGLLTHPLLAPAHAWIAKRPRRYWLWLGATAIAAELLLFLLYRTFFVLPGALERDAFYHSRHVTVDLARGDVVGGAGSHPENEAPASQSAGAALKSAPYELITESSPYGPLPKISGDEMAWQYYAKSYRAAPHHPKIAIVIAGLGNRAGDVDAAMHLPPEVTLSLSPYMPHVADVAERLRGLGFETMIDVPMEPTDYPYSDPGPYAVLDANGDKENLAALHQALGSFSGYIGGVAVTDESITGSDTKMPMLVNEFSHRGILLLYAQNPQNARWGALPFSNAWSALPADVLLDATPDAAHIRDALNALATDAKSHADAIGMLRPYPVSLATLREWLASQGGKAVELVPLSLVAAQRYHIYALPKLEETKAAAKGDEGKSKAGTKSDSKESHEE